MSTVNISENKTLSQTIEKQITATIDNVEVSAKVTMTNGKVTAYMDGQIKEICRIENAVFVRPRLPHYHAKGFDSFHGENGCHCIDHGH